MAKYDYNVVVVGGGTAGLISAYVANTLGGKVALIEENEMGGDCLHRGCVPSKSLIASAHTAANIRDADEFGIDVASVGVNYEKIHQRIYSVIDSIQPQDSAERYRELGIDVLKNRAEWVDGHTLRVDGRTISSRRIIIATGARPRLPEIDGVDQEHVYTSDTIWGMTQLPQSLAVIGGGPIGCELAQAYAQLEVKVTLLEASSRLLGFLSEDQSQVVVDVLEASGVEVRLNAEISSIGEGMVALVEEEVPAETVLIAVGRQPNTEWLENSDIELDQRGAVKTKRSMRTNLKSVYACGDVIGGHQFTHVAEYEAGYAASNAMFDWQPWPRKASYSAVPWTIFIDPEVAHVGLEFSEFNEQKHQLNYIELSEVDRARADGAERGGIWVISDKNGQILGVTIIAPQAGSLIGEWTLAIKQKLSVQDVFDTIHVYPTYAKLNDRVSGQWRRSQVKEWQQRLLNWLAKHIR